MSNFYSPRHIFPDTNNAVGVVTALWAGQHRNRCSIPGCHKNIFLCEVSRPDLSPTNPIQWAP
jgi:hypothetical protein